MEREVAYNHLSAAYPELAFVFDLVGRPMVRSTSPRPLGESVVCIIVGQMLSGAAADTIYNRMAAAAKAKGLPATYHLSPDEMRTAGVSSFKAKAIGEFGQAMTANPHRFERWAELGYEELISDVGKLWGLSAWSASILALSHFGMPDVWPSEDGSIKRAVERLRGGIAPDFDPVHGSPFRSYLARSLWAALDSAII